MRVEWRQPGAVNHELIWGSIAVLLLLAFATLPVDELMWRAGYRCPFRAITGLPCPTCGGTRAWMALGSLKFREGFALNPLAAAGWCAALLYAPYALFVAASGGRRLRVTGVSAGQRRAVAVFVACLVAANWACVILSR